MPAELLPCSSSRGAHALSWAMGNVWNLETGSAARCARNVHPPAQRPEAQSTGAVEGATWGGGPVRRPVSGATVGASRGQREL